MSIGSIYDAKELRLTYQPLLLCEFEFPNGQFLRVSTHPLSQRYKGSPTAGSYEYQGYEWVPRIVNQDIGATQAMSDFGFDIPPQITVVLADPDKTMYLTYENTLGFKGAILKVYAAMWDAGNTATGSFNNDIPIVKFIGTCSASSFDEKTLTVTATSLLNMTQQQMPPIRIQPLCAWNFPPDEDAQLDGLNNPDSPYYQCGYSYSVGGVGNAQSGTSAFTSCPLSRAACVLRLGNSSGSNPIMADNAGHETGRFGGYDYMPIQNNGLQRSYLTGQWDLIINATNEAKYGDYIPICYGTTWVQPEVMGVYGDGNYTRFENLLCFGKVQEIITNVVAGVVVAQYSAGSARPISSPNYTSKYTDNNWVPLNNGSRNGQTNNNIGWKNAGDPYGSVSAIFTQVLSSLSSPSSIPQIQTLLNAGQIFVATGTVGCDDYVQTYSYTSNPAWILLDILVQANWRYTDVDIQSFIDAAAVCDEQIYFNRLDGTYSNVYNEVGSSEYRRFSVGFTVKQRTSIGEVIRGVRNAMRAMLFFDFNTGKLKIQIKSTIGAQQPNPITGSNYNTAVTSVSPAGDEINGYVAYHFDENSIRKTDDNRSTLRLYQRQFQETPNKVTSYFFDRENQYSQDISTIIDVEDVNRIGSEIAGTFNLLGPQTYDHMNRVTATWFAENYRGNPRLDYEGSFIGDTGGTIMAELETSVKALHLMVGQIVLLSDFQTALTKQPFRVMKIQPSQNFETAKITLQWHNDNWYQDTFGQGANQPIYKNTMNAVDRPPYPLRAGYWAVASSPYYDPTEYFYHLAQLYGHSDNPDAIYPSQLLMQTFLPPNSFTSIPRMPKMQVTGTAAVSGSFPASASFYCSVASTSTTAVFTTASFANAIPLSALSNISSVFLPPGYNMPEFRVQSWPDAPTGYAVFAGESPETMTLQDTGTGTPAGISLASSFKVGAVGPPDIAYNALRFRTRSVALSGICELTFLPTASYSSGTTALAMAMYDGVSFATNSLVGREVSFIGGEDNITGNGGVSGGDVIMDFTIVANDGNTMHVIDPEPDDFLDGTLLVENMLAGTYANTYGPTTWTIRMKPTYGSDDNGNYFDDSLLVNPMAQITPGCVVTDATNTSPITITVDDTTNIFNGNVIVLQGVKGNTAANGRWTLGSVSGNTAQLVGSTGNGAFSGNGILFQQTYGPLSGNNMGAFIFAGTGRNTFVPISAFSGTRAYIQGDWPGGVTPDSTSRIILLNMDYLTDQATTPLAIKFFGQMGVFYIDASSYPKNQSVLFQVAKQSIDNVTLSSPVLDQYRELYISNRFLFDGALVMNVQGTLAIGNNQGQPIQTSLNSIPVTIVLQMGTAADAPVSVDINCGGVTIASITILTGDLIAEGNVYLQAYTSGVSQSQVSLFPPWSRLMGGRPITLDITSVGSTAPGADLTATIYFISE